VLSACGISNEDINSIQTGDVVSVDYRVSRSDGTLISDSTLDNETSLRGSGLGEEFASSFNAGDDNILRGEAVVGASSGSILTGTIDPAITQDERFYDRNRIQRVPLNAFIEELKPSINDVIMLGDSYGTVTAIEGDE
jgi:FKBP-type peptidyl-prolyl cis-trans isomerase 2